MFPRPTREKLLPLFLVGALLLCHGVFGTLHLVCHPPECAGSKEHAVKHLPAAGAAGDAPEHSASHETGTQYLAVVVGFLGLLLRLLSKGTLLRIRRGIRWYAVLRRVLAVLFHPPPIPTPLVLQVFRL